MREKLAIVVVPNPRPVKRGEGAGGGEGQGAEGQGLREQCCPSPQPSPRSRGEGPPLQRAREKLCLRAGGPAVIALPNPRPASQEREVRTPRVSHPSWPGSARPSTTLHLLMGSQGVDNRHKAGHDAAGQSGPRHCERSDAIQTSPRFTKTGLPRRPAGLLAMTARIPASMSRTLTAPARAVS